MSNKRLATLCPCTVQALRRDCNSMAHVLFVLYGRIEESMHAGAHSIDDLFGFLTRQSVPSPAVADMVLRKLREDGFTVQPCQARQLLGRWRISWKQSQSKRGTS